MAMSKLKHSDDYRGKIIRDNERFTDKLKDEKSRFVEEEKVGKKKNRKKQRFKEETKASEKQTKEMAETQNDLIEGKSEKELMPLDAQASEEKVSEEKSIVKENAEEGIEENSTLNEEVKNLKKKRKQAQKFRENEEKLKKESSGSVLDEPSKGERDERALTDKQSKVLKEKALREKKQTGERQASEDSKRDGRKQREFQQREESKRVSQRSAKKSFSTLGRAKNSGLLVAEKGMTLTRDYLRSERDNAGVESGEKVADGSSKLIHGIRNYSKKRGAKKSYQLSQNDLKIRKKKSKLEFQEAKKDLKVDADYGKLSSYKKFQ